ncbi:MULTISPECIES: EAL domain-containing protein [Pseudomonas]|uniref:EAL domain-containing protein (Putative c-di-GMP-specific phosphodiesterase class I)/GGDEF domain-containing protein n=1 Tax=Phytopseudomonas flavescens TaxID=29435 RepID=A0A7Z0BLY4_9GAMM|nr:MULTISPECIES: EAL domain-containing protein [Pseudomonas]MCW2293527.1 EAL domain-containing protein (putative c-di-GMP-specific phosphodiesterase class I)/GGDEF domain-containing protein [Pseudomonas sp. BIGb0408]NYH71902.1 EAL domain-containing protein (putative c-di-GMP-specific phosphodiesterase class I)/GGDEF domain-containing protein [Pseudomonas flavescens]
MLAPNPPLPLNELSRQALLDEHPCLLEQSADPFLDEVVKMAAMYFKTPISLITILDRKRQWFRARVGTELQETPRSDSFCAYSVAIGESVEVCDATLDPRFRCNPLVTGDPGIRYYAGVPLALDNGIILGNLCVIDTEPRQPMSAGDMAMLQQMGRLAMSRLNELRIAAFTDGATGLFNHAKLDEDISDALSKGDSPLALAIELVSPAQLNDMLKSLGFRFLTDFTLAVRDTLRALLPHGWELYKISALRFACSVPASQQEQAEAVFRQLVDAFSKPIHCQGLPVLPQIGVGVLRLSADELPADWMRLIVCAADEARTSGRGWAYYDHQMDVAQQRSTRLLNDLADAVRADDQLRLVYQPRVDLHSGACMSVEALLRWTHPTLGEIGPAEFIPLAEKTVLIHAVSFWVINQAITQIITWRQSGLDLKVAINVSAADLNNDHLADEIIRLLARHELNGSCLEVEFTESALVGDLSVVISQLERLKAIGVDIAIDDFGSGYSNWSYLRDIPADTVKLDRSFMDDLRPGQKDWNIVRALISLATELDQRVVAEGIETEQTLQILREWGCQEAQGYFISRPLEAPALVAWLNAKAGVRVSEQGIVI